ncbi:MAG: precorrin-6A/cobalt-precorrin-6A reductase, partial [Prevotellaceae bacterium]|nr:precorrin-6A/cobalt-precorrin-6A reductase [Prevotellaceae bacterium]
MILIFGGTTEGRLAAEVCDLAGKPYWYSTKSEGEGVAMRHGTHISGARDADAIHSFCLTNGVRCIVDAAHPFASSLHRAIEAQGIPVVRLERKFPPPLGWATYCDSLEDALERLLARPAKLLLCLSGASSISKLTPYWHKHPALFRILPRTESIEEAQRQGFPTDRLLFYGKRLPTVEEEMELMKGTGCDAVLTKESGESGGFTEKAEAAKRLGIDLFVIKRPKLPSNWTYVDGRHTLRLALESIVPDFFPLRTGLTTGSCATAATKAALLSLLRGTRPERVTITLPD